MMVDLNLNHSRALDVHIWSDHPELNLLVNELWSAYFSDDLSINKKRGPKPKVPRKPT